MKSLLFSCAAIVCLFWSCGSSSSSNNYGTVPNPTPAPATLPQNVPAPGPAKLVSDTTPPQAVKTSQPAPNITIQNNSKDLVVQPVQTVQAAPPAAAASGLNPAHGQPGHRCDISVGAPLNSAPAAATTTPQVQTITTPSPPAAVNVAKPVKTAPGMNPPHGEPGHRCDISVGAPLNSKPAVTPTPAQVIPSMQAEPAKKDSK